MLCFVFAALVVLLDQLFKRWVFITLAGGGETVLIPGVLSLIYVENTGAAFSMLSDHRWLLVGISFLASLLLIAILLRYNEGFWGTLGLAAVLGGAVGNLIDRVFNGFVIDMFRPLLFPNFAIFNVADIFITLGGITFCIFFIITSVRSEKGLSDSADSSPEDPEAIPYDPYEYEDAQYDDGYDPSSETKVLPTRRAVSGQAPPIYVEPEQDVQIYYTQEPEPIRSYDTADDNSGYNESGQSSGHYEAVQDAADYYSVIQEAPVSYVDAPEQPGDITSALDALDALGALESELGSIDDYEVDDLLREYGFEDDGPV